jgi:hypothetical protein
MLPCSDKMKLKQLFIFVPMPAVMAVWKQKPHGENPHGPAVQLFML